MQTGDRVRFTNPDLAKELRSPFGTLVHQWWQDPRWWFVRMDDFADEDGNVMPEALWLESEDRLAPGPVRRP